MDPKETPLKQIRTFQGDVAEALKRQQESLVSIQRAEHLKNPTQSDTSGTLQDSDKKKKEFFFLFLGSLLLFALGIFGARYTYDEFLGKVSTPTIDTPANRFLSPNTEISLEPKLDSRSTLIDTLKSAVENVPQGELRHIILKQKTGVRESLISASEFLRTLESRAPESLIRAFDPSFMFGALGKSTFLIIKLSSFENAFAGMLSWEKNLGQDIGPLFATAELLKNISHESVFTDVTDKNKDVRALMLENQPILLYSFLDNNMLIITDSFESLRTLIDRLTREKLSR
ncbi:MAG: hypothetical protein A3C70_02560 [Candidatus Zambryskibacteria bacterium RIFCSPHIGHO2_02_FULL_43_14]|uniref:Uncharacterized protein n=1 Tax=Candidatus Zambryskibacteria bacterium RIFCSPHIGHO2_02_FULL_43_14 TaxID=1802748 RepID=A0A1G2TIC7_9BACT|nr:MAG: hypothetical protein A2829_00250 [Candidatus Zambryskibacteria bacterium RIFCSPHIGHO2_01_FULL_43_60]OHA97037.1 MAG: hypothetical protein A3C70_02560 [Candidatus Zambryskibacteria bacterium RIFCSPHIGHO2_02_FULL_43_14]OHB03763.1 MAG: hypothetical protein A3B03_02115 [Candidatus Zambryskibacteria bacterium RIFCSPLOWO2_01_FULL_42_41]